MSSDRRLIEDYLPIKEISEESRIENSVTQARGYLSKALLSILHRWWARRPLTACRAAVYGALAPVDQFRPKNSNGKRASALARANAARFVKDLCRREVRKDRLDEAAGHLRAAHGGRAPRVLDLFAGGGSIPLEAARLGCEAFALDLNPVAHLVELATAVYPAQFGVALVEQVKRWSQEVKERTEEEVADLYPNLPDLLSSGVQQGLRTGEKLDLTALAYLWTRTVPCKHCGKPAPLHRQTWLRKKAKGFVALRPVTNTKSPGVQYELLSSAAAKAEQAIRAWDFDPGRLSSRGETECPFCRTAVPTQHIKDCGRSGEMGTQLMAIAAKREGERGKVYLPAGALKGVEPDERDVRKRLDRLLAETGLTIPAEPIFTGDSRAFFSHLYGMTTFADHFTLRQLLTLLTLVKHVRVAHEGMLGDGLDPGLAKAVATYLAFILDKIAERGANVCRWHNGRETIESPIAGGKMPMVWDFPEANPFGGGSGSWEQAAGDVVGALEVLVGHLEEPVKARRGSALALPWDAEHFDAVVTDPPYYDNVPYAYLADFFHVWLRRSVGHLYPEHFATQTSPVKAEAVMDASRHDGDKGKAKDAYEEMMLSAFSEARRVLRPGGSLVCVYAHKTTSGWATLVDALRASGFVVTEAWPIDTENPSRQRAMDAAALASSIFLVARKREAGPTGSYEDEVGPELENIVRERVQVLWDAGIAGGDLVIAAVGAGLRAFTRFERVEYANGEEVPAERFLTEVECVVMETLLEKILGVSRAGVTAVDGPSRFYVLWRHTYRAKVLEAGEAIVFQYSQDVELDGPRGLSTGKNALVEKKKASYRLRDYSERGEDKKLGLPGSEGEPAPLIDVLHRMLWLVENRPSQMRSFLTETSFDEERLRVLAQALAGAALKGGEDQVMGTTTEEQSALSKLLASWRGVVEKPLSGIQGELFDRKGK